MKKLFPLSYLVLGIVGCMAFASCKDKETEVEEESKPKKNLDAEAKTIENMQSAYKGEKTATAKYAAFSVKAEEEGYHDIAILYDAVSAAENIHAQNHKIVIEDAGGIIPEVTPEYTVKTTKENLFNDTRGEAYEAKKKYPRFLKTAEKADNQLAILSLTYAMKTEQKHKAFFKEVLSYMNKNTLEKSPSNYFVCPACGNTYAKSAPKHCDFTFTEKEKFIEFE